MDIEILEVQVKKLQEGLKVVKKSISLWKKTQRLELTKEKENLIRLECEQLKNSHPCYNWEDVYEKIGAKHYLTPGRIKQIYLHPKD